MSATAPRFPLVCVLPLLFLSAGVTSAAPVSSGVSALERMMVELRPQSLAASQTIQFLYGGYADLLVLNGYAELENAIGTGGLVPLPDDPLEFNIRPRLDGLNPIGEKDLEHQASYTAARPATMGLLIEIASRVKSAPVEVTSLVRHDEYQQALRTTNLNATTPLAMHTTGLAVDIAVVNTRMHAVREIRDVLVQMRDAGDLLFIAERNQLVFHVVPHPLRLGHFTEVYQTRVRPRVDAIPTDLVVLVRPGGFVPPLTVPQVPSIDDVPPTLAERLLSAVTGLVRSLGGRS